MTAYPKQSSPAVKAGVYTRISSDPSGERAGADRQRADCEAHCLARAWEVVEVFCGNDASAYGRKPRRADEQMLAAVETRSIDAIVTWHNDRLHRSPKELEAFIDLVERRGVRLAVVTGGDYDLTTPDGRLSARIVGAVARKESEDRTRRVRRKHLELAEQGRPAGQLGFGWDNGGHSRGRTAMIGFIVFGLFVGVIARLVVPGRQHLSLAMTVGLGLVGSVVGGVVANALGTGDVFELNVLGSLVAIAAAVVLIVVGDRVGLLRRRTSGG